MHFTEQLISCPARRRVPDRLGLTIWSICAWRRAISELPDASREVPPLLAAGCEYREVAGMLDITDSAVRGLVSPARNGRLRQLRRGGRRDCCERTGAWTRGRAAELAA